MLYGDIRSVTTRAILAGLIALWAMDHKRGMAQDYLFWVDQTEAAVYRSKLDGSEAAPIVDHLRITSDVYVDDRQQALYFPDVVQRQDGSHTELLVLRSDLGGGRIAEVFPFPLSGGVNALAVDSARERLYYTEGSRQCTYVVPLTAQTAPSDCFVGNDEDDQIALDLDRGRIYSIGHASLSVADIETFTFGHQITAQTNDNHFVFNGVALDPDHEHVYWVAAQLVGPWQMIQRAHWDRSATPAGSPPVEPPSPPGHPPLAPAGIENVIISQSRIVDIAVDSVHDKVYWIEYDDERSSGGMIRRADLDGTNIETLLSNLSGPVSLALYVQPIPEPSSLGLGLLGLAILLIAYRTAARRPK